MKTFPSLCIAALLTSPAWSEEDPAPKPLPAERYETMASQSPFALATVTAPPAAPQASFAANWFVSGIARLGDADFVTIKSRDAALQFSLFGHEPNTEHGVSVASVNWSETIGKSTVILQKGTEMAKLEFNEADLRGPAPATAAPAPGGVAGAVNIPRTLPGASVVPRPNVPNVTAQRPPTIPNLPPVVTPNKALQQFPATTARPVEIRRRERVIPVPK